MLLEEIQHPFGCSLEYTLSSVILLIDVYLYRPKTKTNTKLIVNINKNGNPSNFFDLKCIYSIILLSYENI